ncbi:MAG TPA: HepT-like ribonuclease domain-containing protein [Chlamydiales bacterium]|nr:HepT-like ribonuclease domain-containing protein [Chlamydiales bacterium]
MLDCTQAILSFSYGRKRIDLDKDRQFLSAILREFEVLGEAANNVSEKARKDFPEFPWKQMIGMRNRLIHAYFDVDHDVIWKTIRDYLPNLHELLQQIVHSLE